MMVLIKKNKGCLKIRIENPISGGGEGGGGKLQSEVERKNARKEGRSERGKKESGRGWNNGRWTDRQIDEAELHPCNTDISDANPSKDHTHPPTHHSSSSISSIM